jgi:UvrB/uvrC motif
MSKDLTNLTSGWPYDANEVRARWIQAEDGKRKLQLRLDLGIFQMEAEGRPDGTRPRGRESLLEFYTRAEERAPGQVLPKKLGLDACSELQQEVMQYYYRIMAFHALSEQPGVLADSLHNLDLIDLVSEYAEDDEVAWQFMQLYPYMRLMHARALSEVCIQRKEYSKASVAVKEALKEMEGFFTENYEPENEDGSSVPPSPELASMRELLVQVERRRPRSQAETLREALVRAVELENYEKAAFLRDQLKSIQGLGTHASGKKRIRPEGRGNSN